MRTTKKRARKRNGSTATPSGLSSGRAPTTAIITFEVSAGDHAWNGEKRLAALTSRLGDAISAATEIEKVTVRNIEFRR